MFIWKCLKGILPVRSSLAIRLPQISPTCPICEYEEEITAHLFCHCSIVSSAWEQSEIPLSLVGISVDQTFNDWLLDWLILLQEDMDRLFLFISLLWTIWKQRNQLVFSNEAFNSNEVVAIPKNNAHWFRRASLWQKHPHEL